MELWNETICNVLKKQAEEIPQKTAYIFDDVRYTWSDMDRISDNMAVSLRNKGVKKGTHVGLWGVNTIEWVLYFFALEKIGALPVLLNFAFKAGEMEKVLSHNDVEFLLVGEPKPGDDYSKIVEEISPKLKDLKVVLYMQDGFKELCAAEITEQDRLMLQKLEEELDCREAAAIVFTSGTTAVPKGALLSHYGLINDARAMAERMRWTGQESMVLAGPIFHCSGLAGGILACLCTGITIVMLRYFSAKPVFEAIEKYQCEIFCAIPAMLLIMKDHPDREKYDLSSFKSGYLGGSALSAEDYADVINKFELDCLLQVYGQTECSPIICMSVYDDTLEHSVKTLGKPLPEVEMRIWNQEKNCEALPNEPGEIQAKGFGTMIGYYKRPECQAEKFTEDGWLRTGDIGYKDAEGYYYFCCRADDMIIRGGENISPVEIEACIRQYSENIKNVRVVGVPDPVLQEELVAFLQADIQIDPDDLRNFVKGFLASYKAPRYIFQIDEFPMTASSKIDDKSLRAKAKETVCSK